MNRQRLAFLVLSLLPATPIMAMRNDLTAAATVSDLVMSNTRIWSYRTNPVRQLAPPAIKRLAEIKCPALVILGEQDLPHIKEEAFLTAR